MKHFYGVDLQGFLRRSFAQDQGLSNQLKCLADDLAEFGWLGRSLTQAKVTHAQHLAEGENGAFWIPLGISTKEWDNPGCRKRQFFR